MLGPRPERTLARIMTERIQNLVGCFDRLAVDALLITDEVNVRYLTGFTGDSSYLLVETDKATLLSDRRYETQISQQCPTLVAAIRPPSQSMIELIQSVVGGQASRNVGIEQAHVSVELLRQLEKKLPEVQWVETSAAVEQLRMIKDEAEVATILAAVQIAERSFQSVVAKLTPKWTEREIAFELEATMRLLGADGVSFPAIVAAEPSGALPHYRPSTTQIGEAATLLIDWGASYAGYASDLTRTLHRQKASDAYRRAYEAVLEAQTAAIGAIGPGVTAREADAAARQTLETAGLGGAFKHGLGHGIGLEVHEAPRLSPQSDQTLQPGMVVTVEPGVYLEGDFGIRIEDDVLVTADGCEVLSTLAKGLDESRVML